MAEHYVRMAGVSGGALTIATVQAGLPMAAGFVAMGAFGALVGHARWCIERAKKNPHARPVPIGTHLWMICLAVLMSEFVSLILLFAWIHYELPWALGLIVAGVCSVFANDAIELMWRAVQARFRKHFEVQ